MNYGDCGEKGFMKTYKIIWWYVYAFCAYFSTAKDQMVRENNGEVREEISKQLDRSVVKDWDYQLEFKKKRAEEAKLAEMAMAQREKQVLKN